jgi:sn-glycerol 3-phosphate transport system permease protein
LAKPLGRSAPPSYRAARPNKRGAVSTRPVTVGLQVFASTDQGIDWSIITAATLLTTGPLLIGFLLFQRQFVQSFMRAGIK